VAESLAAASEDRFRWAQGQAAGLDSGSVEDHFQPPQRRPARLGSESLEGCFHRQQGLPGLDSGAFEGCFHQSRGEAAPFVAASDEHWQLAVAASCSAQSNNF